MAIKTNNFNITILSDDNAQKGLISEHGFSLWIESKEKNILFDTGKKNALIENANTIGLDLSRIDILVLSHGHKDHSGAVSLVLESSPNAQVYCHPDALKSCFSIQKCELPRNISIPTTAKEAILALPKEQIHWVTKPEEICPGLHITGPVPRKNSFEDTGGPFYLDIEGKYSAPLYDDISLWVEMEGSFFVITGCCHSGIINTVEYIKNISGLDKVFGIMGGLHLKNINRERLDKTRDTILSWNPRVLIPCHCTGSAMTEIIRNDLGPQVVTSGFAGFQFSLPFTN